MENLINNGDQNTIQSGQNSVNQPPVIPTPEKPKSFNRIFLALSLFVLLVIAGLFYFYYGKITEESVRKESDSPQDVFVSKPQNPTAKTLSVTTIDAEWSQLQNNKYHYQLKFPSTPQITEDPDHVRVIYEDTLTGTSPFLASIDISTIGLLNEPIEQTASRIAPSELFEKTTLNGIPAININYKNTYSENPEISYRAILVRNSQNLNILIRIDTSVGSKYEELLNKTIQTFRFIDQSNLRSYDTLTLSGTTYLLSGNCMPGAGGDCNRKPISTTVYIYPVINQNSSFTGEKTPALLTKTKSDRNGTFKVDLPPGTYSVYVDDNGKESCTGSDGYRSMCGITLYESDEEYSPVISHAAF